MKYQVTVSLQFDKTVEVEAADLATAERLAEEEAGKSVPGCASYTTYVFSIEEIT